MARVPYLSREDATQDTKEIWDRVEAERKMPTANIFRAIMHAPAQFDGFLTYANALRNSELSPKLRELAILTVGHTTRSQYEIAHHQSHARKAGVTPQQLAAIDDFETSELFDDLERAVMRLAKDSTANVDVTEDRWADVAAHLDDKQMVELTLTIAWYNSGVRIMGLLGIDLEDSYRK